MLQSRSILGVLFFFFMVACSDSQTVIEEANCDISSCSDRGILENCKCECEEGYLGRKCERFDLKFTQKLLNDGVSPFALLNNNFPLDSVYGRKYKDGIIFDLNILEKEVKVVTAKEYEESLQWTNAVNFCDNLTIGNASDWYLPDLQELKDIREILYVRLKIGQFEDDYYWSSETVDNSPNDAYGLFFLNGNIGPIEKDRQNPVSFNFVRAARKIQL